MYHHVYGIYTLDPDPCLSGPCDTNADCTRSSLLNGNFTCACTTGFTGTGFECSGIKPGDLPLVITSLLYSYTA